jgi:hypothetical protein
MKVGREIVVGIATIYGLDNPGFEFRQEKTRLDRLRGPPYSPGFFVWVKWPGREVDYSTCVQFRG